MLGSSGIHPPIIHPSSLNPWLHPLVEAGADIFRLNCSHRRGGDFERVYPLIRQSAKELGKKAGDGGSMSMMGM